MKILKFIFLIVLLLPTIGFSQIDSSLVMKVDSMVSVDQKWRGLYRQLNNKEIDTISKSAVVKAMRHTDSTNFIILKSIFNKHGYLGYSKVGHKTSHNFWLLVQHQDKNPAFQERVLLAMKQEVENNNASYLDYAYLIDRVKVNTGELQIYGTQMTVNSDTSSYIPKAVINPMELNERRKIVGLDPIESYVKTMNERYFGTLKK